MTFANGLLALAGPLPCRSYQTGCEERNFRHYQALNAALNKAIKAQPELIKDLGEEIETAYHGAWLQRYETGLIVHLAQKKEESFSISGLRP